MQEATSETVLGKFDGATFTAHGITSRFFQKDGRYYVDTEGPGGEARAYEIEYAFGVYPLQQYLIAFPGGRYQALNIAWDARPANEGGRRWFHLYPDERIEPRDSLHWTRIDHNWNYMCADCHTTNLRRNFDRTHDRYQTTWSEIGVSCEACHGPGSKHVAWAKTAGGGGAEREPSKGFSIEFHERAAVRWVPDDDAIAASRSKPPAAFRLEVETCGRCHARRSPLGDGIEDGRPLLDSYRVALLTEDLYHPDGQIKEEVYVYGSFLQSKMYAAGVTCSDCHEPHGLKLRAEGNDLCTRCHRPDAFDTPAHHFHASGGAGSRCVDCHAPETTYMVVDPRRDHSFRVPRPDLSVKLGVPNACSSCHEDQPASWAVHVLAQRRGATSSRSPHFGETLAEARKGVPAAGQRLVRIALDTNRPAIVRASALDALGQNLSRDAFPAIQQGLVADNALVRLAALGTLERLSPQERFRAAFPLATDPVRAVRLEAARLLAPVPLAALDAGSRLTLENAFGEFEQAYESMADRPESLLTLGNFYRDRGDAEQSEATYREAISRHPTFGPAYVNLADLYRSLGRDRQGEQIMREALSESPDDAGVLHAFGLLLVRQHRYAEATRHLGRAAELRRDNPHYAFVYALALQRLGDSDKAFQILGAAHERHPNDREILLGLATFSRDRGNLDDAVKYARALVELSPSDPGARQLLESLRASQR